MRERTLAAPLAPAWEALCDLYAAATLDVFLVDSLWVFTLALAVALSGTAAGIGLEETKVRPLYRSNTPDALLCPSCLRKKRSG